MSHIWRLMPIPPTPLPYDTQGFFWLQHPSPALQSTANYSLELYFPLQILAFKPPRGLPYQKEQHACQTFWKELLRGTKILFCGRGLTFFQPYKVLIKNTSPEFDKWIITLHNEHWSPVRFFHLGTLEGTTKALEAEQRKLLLFKLLKRTPVFFIWTPPPHQKLKLLPLRIFPESTPI